ncbi:MAG: isoamylase early set domain-containing protein [Candidatus Methylomirabilales bacterium]
MEPEFEELLERFLEGDLTGAEEAKLVDLLRGRESREDLGTHGEVVRILKEVTRVSPPPSFTPQVIARLPERKAFAERFWELVWAPRTLQWNLASALALLLLVFSLLFLGPSRQVPAPHSTQVAWVRFILHAPRAQQVALAGDFNGWRANETFLADVDGDGTYSVMVPLRPGRYSYMFVVDGTRWVTDPAAEAYRDDGFGYHNAVIRVEKVRERNERRQGYGAV